MQRGGTTDACRFSGSARLPLPKLSLLKLLESGFYLSAYIPQRALYKYKQAMLTNWHGLLLVRLHSSMQGSFDPKCAVVVCRQQSSKQVVCFCLLSALAAERCVLWFANASKQASSALVCQCTGAVFYTFERFAKLLHLIFLSP